MDGYHKGLTRTCALVAVSVFLSTAGQADASLARKLGKPISAYSASLFGKTNLSSIQLQTLTCDPDEPLAGSTSVQYDPSMVSVIGYGRGPGYVTNPEPFSSGFGVEIVDPASPNGKSVIDMNRFFASQIRPIETGYLRAYFEVSGEGVSQTGKLTNDPSFVANHADYTFLGSNGPAGVDTHFFEFTYLTNTTAPATYRVFAETADQHYTPTFGDPAYVLLDSDFVTTQDAPLEKLRPGGAVPFEDATISGSVPEPASLSLVAVAGIALARRRRRPS